MLDLLLDSFILSLPLICSGIIHMMVVRLGFLNALAKPISVRMFGENKTYRGFLVLMIVTIPGVYFADLFEASSFQFSGKVVLGILLGLVYALFELPNSFIKRRLGIAPGQQAKFIFTLIDQSDSVIGCLLVYRFFLAISWELIVFCFIFAALIHLLINVLLFAIGLRKYPL